MSLVIERFLACDGKKCYRCFPDPDSLHKQSTQKLRAESKKCGWHTNGTHDYCPNCWTKRHDGKVIRYLKARFLEKKGEKDESH